MRRRVERLFWLGFLPVSVAVACGSRTEGEFLAGGYDDPSGPANATAEGNVGSTSRGRSNSGSSMGAVGAGGMPGAMTTTRSATSVVGSVTVGGPVNSSVSDTSAGMSVSGGLAGSTSVTVSFGTATTSGAGTTSGQGGMTGTGGAVSSTGAAGTGGVGPCCLASYGLGCDDGGVSACVCDFDPYCCDTAWDEICVQEVEFLSCGICSAPFGGFGGFTATTDGSNVVSSVGGAGGNSNVTVSVGGAGGTGGGLGSCCEVSDGYGCEDASVEACVCDYDPYCCNNSWDWICVDEVEYLGCGVCSDPFGGFGGFTSTTTVTTMTSAGGATTNGSNTTVGEGGTGGVGQCVQQSETECEACLCTDCFEQYGDCIADFGCPEIIACLDESGCSGGSDCLAACGDVIDEFGGIDGASVGYTIAIIGCAINAGCPCD